MTARPAALRVSAMSAIRAEVVSSMATCWGTLLSIRVGRLHPHPLTVEDAGQLGVIRRAGIPGARRPTAAPSSPPLHGPA